LEKDFLTIGIIDIILKRNVILSRYFLQKLHKSFEKYDEKQNGFTNIEEVLVDYIITSIFMLNYGNSGILNENYLIRQVEKYVKEEFELNYRVLVKCLGIFHGLEQTSINISSPKIYLLSSSSLYEYEEDINERKKKSILVRKAKKQKLDIMIYKTLAVKTYPNYLQKKTFNEKLLLYSDIEEPKSCVWEECKFLKRVVRLGLLLKRCLDKVPANIIDLSFRSRKDLKYTIPIYAQNFSRKDWNHFYLRPRERIISGYQKRSIATANLCIIERQINDTSPGCKNDVQRLVRLGYHANKLSSVRDKLNNSKRNKKKAKRIDKANYNMIMIPEFDVKNMIKKEKRKIKFDVMRSMLPGHTDYLDSS
ncbi:8764_t:CDS:2, partial [Scutellospora calospora]